MSFVDALKNKTYIKYYNNNPSNVTAGRSLGHAPAMINWEVREKTMNLWIVPGRAQAAAKLLATTSLAALGLMTGGAALAQDSVAADQGSAQDDQSIIVTGTRIQGVAPVGSPVIPLGREDLLKSGASTTNDALKKLPQVISFGGSSDQAGGTIIQNSTLNSYMAKSVNLRGLGTAATLTLVNSHRVAPQGPNGQLFDADNIPGIAIERIEVIADGGSAIYGSDAVGGVVNYILRRPDNILEVQGQVGFADSVEEYIGSAAVGRKWSTGGFFVAYEYQKRTALEAGARPYAYNSDLSPYGGGLNPIFSSPGNVQFLTNGPAYGIPLGQDGTSLTLGDLTTTVNRQNQWEGADGVPATERHSVVATFRQELAPGVTFNADGFYSDRSFSMATTAAFSTLSVPSNNPYSPCAPGVVDDSATLDCPANGALLVPYSFLNDLGPQVSSGYERIWSLSGALDVEINDSWNANIVGFYSENDGFGRADNQVNTNALRRVLGNTVNGIDKPADVPFLNPFCDGTSFQCNSDATFDFIRSFNQTSAKFRLYGGSVNLGGGLFSIPGGDVKLALGTEYQHSYLFGSGRVTNSSTDNVGIVTAAPTSKTREVGSIYAELFVPIFGADNGRPGLERLELNGAVRYDDYSDVGSTTNPKFGFTYTPVHGLNLRGSFGTSFRAPSLVDVNPYATAGFPQRTATGATLGLEPATSTFNYMYQVGGNPTLQPETAETWSLGVDITNELVPGVTAGINYYQVTYKNRIDTAAYNAPVSAVLNSGIYDDFVVFNPVYFPGKTSMTLADFLAYYGDITSDPGIPLSGGVPDPSTQVAIIDGRRVNSGVIETNGLDFIFQYVHMTDWADFRIGGQANYVLSYKYAPMAGEDLVEEVNHFGYPARFTGRLELGLDKGGFSGTAFVNFVNSREITRAFLPAAVPDQYLNIDSYTTVDMTLSYRFGDDGGLTDGLRFTVSAQNLFDKKPPLVVNSGGTPVRFDPSYSSALGRFVSFSLAKAF